MTTVEFDVEFNEPVEIDIDVPSVNMVAGEADATVIMLVVPGTPGTQGVTDWSQLTGKPPRVGTVLSDAEPVIPTDLYDMFGILALDEDIISMSTNLSWVPPDGYKLWIYINSIGSHSIFWGDKFEDGAVALPTTTVAGQRLDVGLVMNDATGKLRCMCAGSG